MKKNKKKLSLKRNRLRHLNPDMLNFSGGATPACPTHTCGTTGPTTDNTETTQTGNSACCNLGSVADRCAGSAAWALCDTTNCDYY